jgi:hypothetical protein
MAAGSRGGSARPQGRRRDAARDHGAGVWCDTWSCGALKGVGSGMGLEEAAQCRVARTAGCARGR